MNRSKLFPGIVIASLIFVAVAMGGGSLLDAELTLQTEGRLEASAADVYALIADPAGVIKWWHGAHSEAGHESMANMTIKRGPGPAEGPGATVLFEVDGNTAEKWTLVSAEPGTLVTWDVDFQMFVTRRTLRLRPYSGGTKLLWHEVGTFDSPLMRWFTLMPKDSVIENFQAAIRLLEKKAQLKPAQPKP